MGVRGGLLIVAIGLAAALPQTAADSPNYPFMFKVRASSGYTVIVSAHPGGRVQLVTQHSLPSDGSIGASYSVKGKVTRTLMRASFGELGRVAVRMKPSGHFVGDTQCKSQYTWVVREAAYRGKVTFRGEGGYTSVSSKGLRPTINPPDLVECGLTLDRYRNTSRILHASATPAIALGVEKGSASSPTLAWGLNTERNGRVKIVRFVGTAAPSSAFSFDPSGSAADVQNLPAPFQGSAHFAAGAPNSPTGTLTGTLAASFAGGSPVSLAGPAFAAKLEPYYLFDGRL